MNSQKFSLFSALFIVFVVGFIVREFKLFPYQVYAEAAKGFERVRDTAFNKLPWYYPRIRRSLPKIANNSTEITPGLTLVTRVGKEKQLLADIVDRQGNIVHQWNVDWFELWPDANHIPEKDIPREQPGTHIHGAVVMENGDLIFNFENLGLIRLNRDSEVVWRLPYMTHHSIHRHDDGNLWVSGRKNHNKQLARLPHLRPPFYEDTILVVSPEGEVLKEWYIADILQENGYEGVIYLGTLNHDSVINGLTDLFHLNDVEPFSNRFEEGFFTQGDVLVSLRNINTVFVFNSETNKIKYISIGQFVRQHDPDFIDGNTFSVFNNNDNNTGFKRELRHSQIVVVSAQEDTHQVYFEGTAKRPFFTRIMGKHQWLPNGNLLITDSMSGRGFEINQEKEIIWQYINYVDKGVVGIVEQVDRLPIEYNQVFPASE